MIDGGTVEQEAHAARHRLLHRVGLAQRVELLAPSVDLTGEVDLYGTDIVARAAERAGRDVVAVIKGVAQHAEVDADGTGYEVGVAVARRPSVDGAGIHTGATTHTLQSLPVFRITEDAAAAVVDEDDVHLAAWTRPAEVAGVDGGLLASAVTCQQALEDAHGLIVGDELLDAHRGDVQFGNGCRHIGVAFVGADDDVARFGDAEVGPRHAGICLHELTA